MNKFFSWLLGQQPQTIEGLCLEIAQALLSQGEIETWFATLEVVDQIFPLLRQFVPELDIISIRPTDGKISVFLRDGGPARVSILNSIHKKFCAW